MRPPVVNAGTLQASKVVQTLLQCSQELLAAITLRNGLVVFRGERRDLLIRQLQDHLRGKEIREVADELPFDGKIGDLVDESLEGNLLKSIKQHVSVLSISYMG